MFVIILINCIIFENLRNISRLFSAYPKKPSDMSKVTSRCSQTALRKPKDNLRQLWGIPRNPKTFLRDPQGPSGLSRVTSGFLRNTKSFFGTDVAGDHKPDWIGFAFRRQPMLPGLNQFLTKCRGFAFPCIWYQPSFPPTLRNLNTCEASFRNLFAVSLPLVNT